MKSSSSIVTSPISVTLLKSGDKFKLFDNWNFITVKAVGETTNNRIHITLTNGQYIDPSISLIVHKKS